ncbi:MAG: hypothetical protein OSJ70_01885 [Bacilli bacterium]|nr:hypothetical protein [Bacilli bacterium]
MYEYKLNKDEEVFLISDGGKLKKEKDFFEVTTIITNQRFLILETPKDLENFRVGRSINYPIKKEIIFEIPVTSIVNIEIDNISTKYTLDSTNYFYLDDSMVYNYMKKLIV